VRKALALAALRCLLATGVMVPGAMAQTTPAGLWRTFDDTTGRERGRVLIEEHDGVFSGKIVGTVDPADAARRCERCSGARYNAPVIGLPILTGMRSDGDHWDGGEILDPQSGNVYDCTMRFSDAGHTLIVRGYLGIALLGRSQTWLRATPR
jgi:uncharacterized protein (DUF2147 family)